MVKFAPTGASNDYELQAMIRRESGAPPGPVTIMPGQGFTRVMDGAGNELLSLDPEGVRAYVHGATRSLPGIIETKASTTYVDGNIRTLVARDGELQADINTRATRTYVDGNISTLVGRANSADSRLDGHDTAIAARATRTYVDGNISTIVGRLNGLDSAVAARATRTYVDGNIATLVQRDSEMRSRINAIIAHLSRGDPLDPLPLPPR